MSHRIQVIRLAMLGAMKSNIDGNLRCIARKSQGQQHRRTINAGNLMWRSDAVEALATKERIIHSELLPEQVQEKALEETQTQSRRKLPRKKS